MDNQSHQHQTCRRIRQDRLVGFRLNPQEYAALNARLGTQRSSLSAYLRRLVRADIGNAEIRTDNSQANQLPE